MKWASTVKGQGPAGSRPRGAAGLPLRQPARLTCVLLGQHGPVHHLPERLHPRPLLRLRLAGQQKPALWRDDGDPVRPVMALGGWWESVQHRVAALSAADEDFPAGEGILGENRVGCTGRLRPPESLSCMRRSAWPGPSPSRPPGPVCLAVTEGHSHTSGAASGLTSGSLKYMSLRSSMVNQRLRKPSVCWGVRAQVGRRRCLPRGPVPALRTPAAETPGAQGQEAGLGADQAGPRAAGARVSGAHAHNTHGGGLLAPFIPYPVPPSPG